MEDVLKKLMGNEGYALGSRTSIKMLKQGKAKLVVLSSNCPREIANEVKNHKGKAKIVITPKTSLELGQACGKPFPVSAIAFSQIQGVDIKKLGTEA